MAFLLCLPLMSGNKEETYFLLLFSSQTNTVNFRLERKECHGLVVQAVMEGEGQRVQAAPNLVWPP